MGVSIAVLAMAMVTLIIVVVRWLQYVHQGVLNLSLYAWATLQSLVLALIFNTLEEFNTKGTTWEDIGAMVAIGVLWAIGNLCLVLALQIEEAGIVG